MLRAVGEIESAYGPIDLAVLNAGTYDPIALDEFSSERTRDTFAVNFFEVVHGIEALLPAMRRRGAGYIAVMASIAGYCGLPYAAAYSASKSALTRLCESPQPELAGIGIRLSVINPGFVRTPLTAKNEFPMPFLVDGDEAARVIAAGLTRGDFKLRFPRRMAIALSLPYAWFFALA